MWGDAKVSILSACGATKQGVLAGPGPGPIPSGTGHPLSFYPVWQRVTPVCLGPEAGRYFLTWEKSPSSVVTSALMSSLFQGHQSHFTGWKTEVLLVQGGGSRMGQKMQGALEGG